MPQQISIVIPILNEAATIVRLLKHLIENSSIKNIEEIVVVDGGSKDQSIELIKTFINKTPYHSIKLIHSKKGRAKQLNEGASQTSASILYFLHADSFPPKNFDAFIIDEVNNGHLAGCFIMQFDSSHWWLLFVGWMTRFSWRACRGGDQSQFITRELFNEIGGYDEDYIIYEDNILINELYNRHQFVVINKKLHTSARRYEHHGVWKLQFHFLMIYIKKWFGASAEELHHYYKKHIS